MNLCIQIGNSDNKLTQEQWAFFVEGLQQITSSFRRHFSGGSNPNMRWQNWCVVIEFDKPDAAYLLEKLQKLCVEFNQDSIAIFQGDTAFVTQTKLPR